MIMTRKLSKVEKRTPLDKASKKESYLTGLIVKIIVDIEGK